MKLDKVKLYRSEGYVVVWCERGKFANKDDDQLTDHYKYYTTKKNAQKVYNKLIKLNSVYSASICSIIESTDYPMREC